MYNQRRYITDGVGTLKKDASTKVGKYRESRSMKKSGPDCSSDSIRQSVEDFLAKGGRITSVEVGASGEDNDFSWNQSRYPLHKKPDKRSLVDQHIK